MRKLTVLSILLLFFIFIFSGCASVSSPVNNGLLVTNVKGPVAATKKDEFSKVGRSSCVSVLGLVSAGDASIDAAIKEKDIDEIHHIDHKSTSVLGVFAKYTTIVYGN